jgi:ABC-2 type transport system permease protein
MSIRRILGMMLRHYYAMTKGPIQLSDLFYWPLVDILLWGITSVWIQTQNNLPNLPLLIMTGLIFWQVVIRGAFDISMGMCQEFWNRNLVNLFSSPLKISEWSAGMVLTSFLKLSITISFGSVVIWMLYALNVFTLGWAFLPFVISLVLFGWAIGFLAASMIIYWGHQVEAIAFMIGFVFAPFSAVFYPVKILPIWAQKIAWALPTTYVFEGMRQILSTGIFPTQFFWTSIFLDLIYLLATLTFFHFMFEKSRTKGLGRLE